MSFEQIKNSPLPRALGDVVADVADLFQKELRLARAELSENVSRKLRGGVWMSAAGVLGLVATLLVVQAAVFAVASFGIEMHWACLIVAAILGAAGALAYAKGRTDVQADLMPGRTIEQVKRDINTTTQEFK